MTVLNANLEGIRQTEKGTTVTDMTREQIIEKLKEFVSGESGMAGINEGTKLMATGVLDSLLIVSIISFCEQEFSCAFGPDEFEEQHFENIGALADQVCRNLDKQKALR
jgi:acyl carrier protein